MSMRGVNHCLPVASTTIYPIGSTLVDMGIGDRLKALREKAGLDQPGFAAIAGTTKQAVSQIENGRTKVPGGLYLLRWAKHCDVNLEWLITGKGDERPTVSQPARPTPENIMAAARLASAALVDPHPLDPSDPLDAELLSLALEDVIAEGIEDATDSDALRFVQRFHRRGGKDGKGRSGREDGRAGGNEGSAETGGKGNAAGGRRRKRVA